MRAWQTRAMSADEKGEAATETLGVVSLDAMAWTWIRRRSALQWGLLAVTGLVAAAVTQMPGLVLSAAFFVALGVARLALGARTPKRPRKVTASLEGLHIEGRPPTSARRLRSATIAKLPEGFQVDITRRFAPPIRLVAAHPEQARRIIDALGLGLDHRVFQTRLLSPIVGLRALAVGWGIVASAFVSLAFAQVSSGWSVTAWFCLMLTAVVLSNVPTRLRIGRDALETRWLWRRRSLRVTELARLEALPRTWAQPHRVRVHRHDGAPIDLPVSQHPKGHPAALEEVSRVIERIEAAMHALPPGVDPRFGEWNRSRAVLTPELWLAALRQGEREYRQASMPFDSAALLDVLDDAGAALEDRAAAAVALGARSDAAIQVHLLRVTRTSALPELVKVIEAACSGDDAGLVQALRRVPRVRVALAPDVAAPEAAAPETEDAARARAVATGARARRLR